MGLISKADKEFFLTSYMECQGECSDKTLVVKNEERYNHNNSFKLHAERVENMEKSKRRIYLNLAAMVVMIFATMFFAENAYAETADNFTYSINNDKVYITRYDGEEEVVNLPGVLGGYPVVQMNAGAIKDNETIKKLIIPESVTYLQGKCVQNCPNLAEVVMNNNLSGMENYTFDECINLKKITFGAKVSSLYRIEKNMQYGPYIEEFAVDASNTEVSCRDGILYRKGGKQLALVPVNYPKEEFTVVPEVTEIYNYAFSGNKNLRKVTLGKNVENYGDASFTYCEALEEIVFQQEQLYLAGSNNQFQNCKKLNKIRIEETPRYINGYVFAECDNLTTVEYGRNATAIFNEVINWYIREYVVDPENENFTSEDGVIYNKALDTIILYPPSKNTDTYTIRKGTKIINSYAFRQTRKLKKLVFPDSLTTLQENAIDTAYELEEIQFGKGTSVIEGYAVRNADKVTELHITGNGCVIKDCSFYNLGNLKKVIIGSGVKEASGNVFYKSDAIEKIEIGKDVECLGDNDIYGTEVYKVFSSQRLKELIVDEENTNFVSIDSVLYTKDMKELLRCPRRASLKKIEIPSQVEKIGEGAFEYNQNIAVITLGENVTEIGNYAFQYASVENIVFNNKISEIGYGFRYCEKLEEIVLPQNVRKIARGAFDGCYNLSTVTFLNPKATIEGGAYYDAYYTVIGYKNSTAQTYAQEAGVTFRDIQEQERDDGYYAKNTASSTWDGKTKKEVKSASDTYAIESAEQLAWLAETVNSGKNDFYGKKVVLACDIDLKGYSWKPIGISHENSFRGSFYGQHHTISNLTLDDSYIYRGLFGYWLSDVAGRTLEITDLNIENVYSSGRGDRCGAVVGVAKNLAGCGLRIDNCTSTGELTMGNGVSGGIAGLCYGGMAKSSFIISNCRSECEIYVGGGIVGALECMNKATKSGIMAVKDCYFSGSAYGGRYCNNGGIVGQLWRDAGQCTMKIYRCYNKGNISGSYCSSGGILSAPGKSSSPELVQIYSCINAGSVNNYNAGGIVGDAGSAVTVYECYNMGRIAPNAVGSPLGGITANIGGNSIIRDCYNDGEIVMGTMSYPGGIGGRSGGRIERCYNIGKLPAGGVSSVNAGFPGAMLPMMGGTIMNCFYDKGLWGQALIGTDKAPAWLGVGANNGVFKSGGLTTAEMKKASSFVNWDFGSIWEIDKNYNYGYPILRSVKHMMMPTGSGKKIKVTVYGESEKGRTPLEGAEITCDTMEFKTNSKGVAEVVLPADNDEEIAVSHEGYITRKFKGKKFAKLKKVVLQPGEDDEPLFVSAEGWNKKNNEYINLLDEKWLVTTGSKEYAIKADVQWPEGQDGTIYIEQESKKDLYLNDDSWTEFPIKHFDYDSTNFISLVAETDAGVKVRKRIKIQDSKSAGKEQMKKLFPFTTDLLQPDVALIDQLSLEMDISPVKMSYTLESDNTYKVMLGLSLGSISGDDGEVTVTDFQGEFDETYDSYKKALRNMKDKSGRSNWADEIEPLKKWELSASLMGYSEGTYEITKEGVYLTPTEQSCYLKGKGSIGDEYQTSVGWFPVVIGWDAALEIGAGMEKGYNPDEILQGAASVKIEFGAHLGVGLKKVASGGMGGSIGGTAAFKSKSLLTDILTKRPNMQIDGDDTKLEGKVYLYVKVFGTKLEEEIFSGTWKPFQDRSLLTDLQVTTILSKDYLGSGTVLHNDNEQLGYEVPNIENITDRQVDENKEEALNVQPEESDEKHMKEESDEQIFNIVEEDASSEVSTEQEEGSEILISEEDTETLGDSERKVPEEIIAESEQTSAADMKEQEQEAENSKKEVKTVAAKAEAVAASNSGIQTIISNTYSDGSPQIVTLNDGRKMLVWVGEASLSEGEDTYTTILYSINSGGAWSTPEVLDNDGKSSFSPVVATDGENVYVVWEKAKEPIGTVGTNIDAIAGKIEIAVSVYDGTTFSQPYILTNNDYLDSMPTVFTNGADTMVAWVANEENAVFSANGRDNIWCADYKEGSFSEPYILKSLAGNVLTMTGTYDELGNYALIYNIDRDGDTSTSEDMEIMAITPSGTIGLTNNTVIDTNPVLTQMGHLYWKQGQSLAVVRDLSKLTEISYYSMGDIIDGAFDIAENAEGDCKILWAKGSVNSENAMYTELYIMTFDVTSGILGKPIRLTDYGLHLNQISAVMDENGTASVLCNIIQPIASTQNNLIGEGQCDIGVITLRDYCEISIGQEYYYNVDDIVPGETLGIEFEIYNTGTRTVHGYTTKIYDSQGNAVGEEASLQIIPSGDRVAAACSITVPESGFDGRYRIVVEPSDVTDENSENNELSVDISTGQMACKILDCVDRGEDYLLTVSVKNESYYDLEQGINILLRTDNTNGELLRTVQIDNLQPQESTEVQIDIKKEDLEFEEAVKALYVQCESATKEEGGGSSDFTAVENYNRLEPCTVFISKMNGKQIEISLVNNHSDSFAGKVILSADKKNVTQEISLAPFERTRVTLQLPESKYASLSVKVMDKDGNVISNEDQQQNDKEPEKYTVTFHANGGKAVKAQIVEEGGKAKKVTTTRPNHIFAGWYLGSKSFDFNTVITKNIILTAKWNPIYVKSIKVSGASKAIAAGKKIQLTAAVSPSNALNKGVVWKTSNKKYATVSQSGKVTLKKKAGGKTVTISAVSKDTGKVKGQYKISIKRGIVTKIQIRGNKTVKAGKSTKLKAKITTKGGNANKKLKWTSGNKKYLKVTSTGKITAYKAGKGKRIKVTAAATDGSGKKATFTIKIK